MADLTTTEGRIVWQQLTSHYGRLQFLSSKGGDSGIVVKAILPWHFVGLGMEQRSGVAQEINEATLEYRRELEVVGVPLGEYECGIAPDGHPEHVMSYLGQSADELITHASYDERRRILRMIIVAIEGVLRQEDPPRVGVDAQLSNFCVNNGKAIYVDTFPALVRRNDSYLVHWPNPTSPEILQQEVERKFRANGILRRLRFTLLRTNPEWESELNLALGDVLGHFGLDVVEHFNGLIDTQASRLTPTQLKERIEEMGAEDVDSFRELALRLVPFDARREEILARVFDLSSHYSSRGIAKAERLAELRILLQSYVS